MTLEGFLAGLFCGVPAVTEPTTKLRAAIAAVAPRADAATWEAVLGPPMRSSGITTNLRVAAFLGQCAVESEGFTRLSEDLNYSAARLREVWPERFPTLEDAEACAGKPEDIACVVYADRMGNGPASSQDGWTFRGGGLIQITGRDTYCRLGAAMHCTGAEAADRVRTPSGAAFSACWFWSQHSLNGLADGWQIEAITRRINGGSEGLTERLALSNAALRALG